MQLTRADIGSFNFRCFYCTSMKYYFIQLIKFLDTETENCSSVNYPSYHYLVEVLDYNRTDNFSIPVNTYFTPTPGSTYSFIYKARRPGLWGIGPASNPLTIKIPCQSEYHCYAVLVQTLGSPYNLFSCAACPVLGQNFPVLIQEAWRWKKTRNLHLQDLY